jgi:putative MFS transporter
MPSDPEGRSAASLRVALAPQAGLISLVSIATFFEGFDTKLAGLVQPMLGAEFGAGPEELGLVLGISSLGMVVAFFVLHLADWFGRRPVFLGALLAYTLLTLATAMTPNLVVFTALQFFARMAMVVELALAYLILSESLAGDVRGRANGILGAFAAIGAAVPPALVAPLEAFGFGWRGLFVLGALPVFLVPFYFLHLRETRAFETRPEAAHRFSLREEAQRARALIAGPRLGILASITLVWFSVNFWAGSAMGFFTIYTYGERGWSAAELFWLPFGTIPVGAAGYLFSGYAMDRFGRRSAATIYLVAAFLVTLLCYRSSSNTVIYLAWFCLIGLNGIWTILMTWTAELFPTELRATALGVCNNLLGRLGMVFGPILAGQLSGFFGSTSSAISVLAVAPLVGLPLIWRMLPETKGKDLS